MFNSYDQVMQYLDELGPFKMDFGLERMQEALSLLKIQKPPCIVVQIVGTNGKGSTASFLDSIARAHGLRCGLYTSPHLVSVKERVLFQGKVLSDEQWLNYANDILRLNLKLTYFEFLTVFAVNAFSKCNVDLIILEAGLGGYADATTAVFKHILCITAIDMDHENILGADIYDIARQKAGAISPCINVYRSSQYEGVITILDEVAKTKAAKLSFANKELPFNICLGLKGKHQEENASLALMVWEDVALRLNCFSEQSKIKQGLERAFIAGRCQYINTYEEFLPPSILLDGAHNSHGLSSLIFAIDAMLHKPQLIIFSCLADKNMQSMLIRLLQLHDICNKCPFVIVGLDGNERALSLTHLEDLKLKLDPSKQSEIYILPSLSKALEFANTRVCHNNLAPVLICGSLYLLGEFFSMFPHYLRPSLDFDTECK